MKHTPSTIQKDPAKFVKKTAKNCVPKKVNPKGMKKNTKRQVTNKVIPKDVKKSNGDESSHGENVKSTIKKYTIKKVIPKGKVNCQRMMPLRSRVASMNQSLETNFGKGGNDRQERK